MSDLTVKIGVTNNVSADGEVTQLEERELPVADGQECVAELDIAEHLAFPVAELDCQYELLEDKAGQGFHHAASAFLQKAL